MRNLKNIEDSMDTGLPIVTIEKMHGILDEIEDDKSLSEDSKQSLYTEMRAFIAKEKIKKYKRPTDQRFSYQNSKISTAN